MLILQERAPICFHALSEVEGFIVRFASSFPVVLAFKHIQRSLAVEVDQTEPVDHLAPSPAQGCQLQGCPVLQAHEGLPKPLFMPVCDTKLRPDSCHCVRCREVFSDE
jgi:hypothetical protein